MKKLTLITLLFFSLFGFTTASFAQDAKQFQVTFVNTIKKPIVPLLFMYPSINGSAVIRPWWLPNTPIAAHSQQSYTISLNPNVQFSAQNWDGGLAFGACAWDATANTCLQNTSISLQGGLRAENDSKAVYVHPYGFFVSGSSLLKANITQSGNDITFTIYSPLK